MESIGLNNYNGYKILIELLAIKVYDEKFNEILNFYITEQEENSIKAGNYDENFLERIYNLFKKAKKEYKKVLSKTITEINKNSQGKFIGLKNNYMKLLMYTIKEFQDYNIVESSNGSFNQIIFHNFAKYFSKMEQNQFVTPIQIIDFLVYIINPKVDDTICDPCSGIADFLVMSHRYCKEGMSDEQLYGIDIDPDIIVLSQFNLILNGDGNANLEGGYDSLLYKFKEDSGMIKLDPKYNKNGNWDYFPNASDKLEKFSIVLTNPPFGKGRALEIGKQLTKSEAEMYELYNKYQQQGKSEKTKIDKGVLFLENAVRILDENGRMGIVLSNSIVSIDTWKFVREWLLDNLRIVALFDLPENIFGEAGVNTNLIVGYKPKNKDILKEDYEIFIKDIKNVGYEKKSKKRNVVFVDKFKFDMKTFERQKDKEGNYIINEDFTETLKEFKEWAKSQEKTIKDLFL